LLIIGLVITPNTFNNREKLMRSILNRARPCHRLVAATAAACASFVLWSAPAHAADFPPLIRSSKLLLTGGVTSVEGAAGGGLTPWAVIGGYGTKEQIGGNAFATNVRSNDYNLRTAGLLLGLYDRVELSFADQRFDTRNVGGALGLGNGFTFGQKIYGLKVKIAGDAVLEQDSWLPQLAVGVQHKQNNRGELLRALGIRRDRGTDIYLSATKLFLNTSLLVNGTVRATKANQTGILGFGTAAKDKYAAVVEGSIAYLLRKDLAVGIEFRQKPDNLPLKEDDWFDLFIAYAPTKNVSITLAYADLGNIVIKDKQRATYLSIQMGF
jgi:Protein of unknown function (DUF3034)